MKYGHSSYFFVKKRVKDDACGEMSARDVARATKTKLRAQKIKNSRSDALPMGVVELTRASVCFEMMKSRDDEVAFMGLRGLLPALIVDFAVAMKRDAKRIRNRVFREKYKAELQKQIAILRREERAEREKDRRRALAAERRKIRKRTTLSPQPDPEQLITAWRNRKQSHEAMIILGGMLQDLECYVDNCLKINEFGVIVGRNGGIRSWLKACAPELAPHYKSLMRYKAMAKKLRQATNINDPIPTWYLLAPKKLAKKSAKAQNAQPHEVIVAIRALEKATFHLLEQTIEFYLGRLPEDAAREKSNA